MEAKEGKIPGQNIYTYSIGEGIGVTDMARRLAYAGQDNMAISATAIETGNHNKQIITHVFE